MTVTARSLTTMSSYKQVAKRLNISLGTLRKLVEEGRLTSVRISTRCVRISDSEVESLLSETRDTSTKGEA